MTTSEIVLDPVVLDALADDHVVDLLSRLVAYERAIRRELRAANPANFAPGTPQGVLNDASSKARAFRTQAQHEMADVRERLSLRITKFIEDAVRSSEES